jgi:predicted aspartyl protease
MATSIVEPKRGANVGRVVVDVAVENFEDRVRAQRGEIKEAEVRRVTVPALVDTGATFMCMPKSLVDQLGLTFVKDYVAKTVTGPLKLALYAPAWIETQERYCVTEVLALPEDRQVLLGQIPLEMMDWWVDVSAQKLTGNPEHGGQWQVEV